MDQNGLNENHRRALGAALKQVERTLDEFVRLLRSEEQRRPPASSPSQLQAVLEAILDVQERIGAFRWRFTIPASPPRDLLWTIQVGASHLWEILEDCKAEKLRGYGEVPHAVQPALDGHVQDLIEAVERLAACTRRSK